MPDPKVDSTWEKPVRSRETEDLLRQFTNHDGPKGASESYRRGYEATFCGHPEMTLRAVAGEESTILCDVITHYCAKCGTYLDADMRPVK